MSKALGIPSELVIGYRRFAVVYKPRSHSKVYGTCDTEAAKIEIFKHKDMEGLANTLFHEAIHAIYKESGLNERIGEVVEEDMVKTFSDCLCMFIQQNPEAFKWIIEKLGVTFAVAAIDPVG